MYKNKDLKAVVFIFLLTLIIGLSYLKFEIIFPATINSDTIAHYDPIALSLIQGQGFAIKKVTTARVPPGFPFFLAVIYSTFGYNHNAVRIIQFLILAIMAITVYFMGKRSFGLSEEISFLASLALIIWPYFILYSTFILTEILFTFLLTLSVYFLINFWKEKDYKNALISGFILGIAMLVRSVILLLPIWISVFLLIFGKLKGETINFKKIIIFTFTAFIVISPWILRNFLQFNSFIPIQTGLDNSLKRAFVTYDYTEGSSALKPDEVTLKTAILSRLKNIYLFWNPGAQGENARTMIERYSWANFLFFIYKFVFLLIVATAFLSLRFIKKKEIFILWSVIFYFWAIHIVLYPYPRYTLPIIPLVILSAAVTLSDFIKSKNLKTQIFS